MARNRKCDQALIAEQADTITTLRRRYDESEATVRYLKKHFKAMLKQVQERLRALEELSR
jgi:uncharacterized coiled-coil protein SlyX